jgi:putative ABC transport system permease protein
MGFACHVQAGSSASGPRVALLSIVLGFQVAYYLMKEFLSQYEFHTELSSWAFLITGGSVLILSAFTVIYSSAKAALANPAETLRTE